MSAVLEYAVFGQVIAVSGEDGGYVARLDAVAGSVLGRGPTPLAALGDCVVRWSAGRGGPALQRAEKRDDACVPSEDHNVYDAGDAADDGNDIVYQALQPRIGLLRGNGDAAAKATRRPAAAAEEHVLFGQRVWTAREGKDHWVAQIEGRGRMWWGHGRSASEALADCVLNWAGPLLRVPDELDGPVAEYVILGEAFEVLCTAEGYVAQVAARPALCTPGATPREALAACILRWAELQQRAPSVL